jgi:uncharacterized membrane protein
MKPARFLRHLFSTRWNTRRLFTPQVLASIEGAIREAESRHVGEIRFVVETHLGLSDLWHDVPARRRAVQVFGQLGVWDTAHNNGVLIYVLLADRVVEILADRGIANRIAQSEWDAVCGPMQAHYREGRFAAGSVAGVQRVGELLARHFPTSGAAQSKAAGTDELPNQPLLL